jgi:alpha-soluble NSF attachment protein
MSVQQAQKCVAKAKEALKGSFFGNMMSSKKDRMGEAVELYKEAAQQYKIAGDKANSIDCLKQAASLYQGMEDVGDAADCLSNAGDLLKEDSPADACSLYKQCAEMYIKNGKCGDAAKVYRQISEIYEKEYEYELAVTNLKEAARLFDLEKFNKTDAEKANIKVAELLTRDLSTAKDQQVIEAIKVLFPNSRFS